MTFLQIITYENLAGLNIKYENHRLINKVNNLSA